jgi:hypothetical protein
MVNISKNYKRIELEIDGKVQIVPIKTSEAWNVFEFDFDGNTYEVNENDTVSFVTESGEKKNGIITKILGTKEKTKVQIIPTGMECEEIWSVMSIKDGTFRVIKTDNTESDEE